MTMTNLEVWQQKIAIRDAHIDALKGEKAELEGAVAEARAVADRALDDMHATELTLQDVRRELEGENRELKSENRRLESDLANERDTAGYWIAQHESQDAITAWAMGFE